MDEIAALVASQPTRDALLAFRPSPSSQARMSELLDLQRQRALGVDEVRELDQFMQAEMLMRLVKARLRAARPSV
jgi:hypothetical protein